MDAFGRVGARLVVVESPADEEVALERDWACLLIATKIARELESPDPFTPLAVEGLALELAAAARRLGSSAAPAWLERASELALGLASVSEIAAELDVSVAAVETLLFRARGAVAQQLEQAGVKQSRGRSAVAVVFEAFQWLFKGGAAPLKLAAVAATVATTASLAVVPAVRDGRPVAPPVQKLPLFTTSVMPQRGQERSRSVTEIPRRAASRPQVVGDVTATPTVPAATDASPQTSQTPTSKPAPPAAATKAPVTTPAPTAAAPALPAITVPAVTVPTVSLPDLQLPEVKLPAVQLPPVQLPPVKLPAVQLPKLP